MYADLSKTFCTTRTESLLQALAHDCGWQARRDAMLAGAADQHHRAARRHALAAAHAARWRAAAPAPGGAGLAQAQWDTLAAAHDTLNAMLALAEQVRADRQITDIVNIGIGGSHLGPEVVVQGLEDWVDAGKRFHFVSNVDGHELGHVLRPGAA